MIFNLVSIVSALALALPILAGPVPVSGLNARAEWPEPKTYKVTVGALGQLRYDPEYVYAEVGDYVKFIFQPKNHTVTESSFDDPCNAIDGGFLTGFVPVPENQTSDFPTRNFKVIDDKPHWFYCGQIGHCPAGMVFAVNPPKEGNTFDKFQAMAQESSGKL
ncbi:unnamed protein product [Rhizoctonia solani]|uniref:Phytocyanin domain-containing protein n=1 Tax=Rhizoctonia solani TaxID=456999 RepID=A0A8H3CAD8_9AGAM|nr:unnamed protein product [Rhizoctonia solani]